MCTYNITGVNNMRKTILVSTLLAAALVSVSSTASAEGSLKLDCSLRVSVVDKVTNERLQAEVTVEDVRHGWTRTKNTNSKGHALFNGIRPDNNRPGNQLVTVKVPGYTTQVMEGVACPHGNTVGGWVRMTR